MTGAALTSDAPAKLNLALVVGPLRSDRKHEVITVLHRLDLADQIEIRSAESVSVEGFEDDTIVRAALELLLAETGSPLSARIDKQIPVAAGLGGGSSDAAVALRLGNILLGEPLSHQRLHELAVRLGADVPFFLTSGPQLGTGDGSTLTPVTLPVGIAVLLAFPRAELKESTASVYRRFDERRGSAGFDDRRKRLLGALGSLESPHDLAALPANDLASSPLTERLCSLGAFRADVTGAGPVVYGLFDDERRAHAASEQLVGQARTWVTRTRR